MIRVTWLMTTGMTHSQTWHSHSKCDMTPSYMWHHSIICVTWLITAGTTHSQMWHVSLHMWHDSFVHVTWLTSYVWHDSLHQARPLKHVTCLILNVTWLLRTCDITQSYVRYDSLPHARLTHKCDMSHSICDMSHSYMWHDSLHMCDMTHYRRHDSPLFNFPSWVSRWETSLTLAVRAAAAGNSAKKAPQMVIYMSCIYITCVCVYVLGKSPSL